MNELKTKVGPTGKLRVVCRDAQGNALRVIEENNLVVNTGRQNFSRLLGGDAAGYAVTQFSVGTDGTPPALTDTAITGAFDKAVEAIAYPGNDVQFSLVLETSEANGTDIREWGLKNSNGDLVARVTPAVIQKTNAIRVEATWTIQF